MLIYRRTVLVPVLCLVGGLCGSMSAAAGVDAGSTSMISEGAGDALSATMTISRAELEQTGHTRLSEALEAVLPALSQRHAAASNGEDHVPVTSLRGLAPDQMLVLVNGKRRHAAGMFRTSDAPGQGSVGVDLDAVPISALARVEVLLGSASGRFGGDALAGVLNLVLDDSASGGHLQAQYGQRRSTIDGVPKITETFVDNDAGSITHLTGGTRNVDDGDGDTLALSGSWGFDLTDRGFMRVSAGYWGVDSTNRAGFDPSQQYPLQPNGDFDIRETTVNRLNAQYGQPERDELDVQFNAGLQLSDSVELYGFTALAARNSESAASFSRPIDPVTQSATYPDGFLPLIRTNIDDRTFTIGVRGQSWDWDWDLSYGVMNSEIDWKVKDTLNPTFGTLSQHSFKTGNTELDLEAFNFDVGRDLVMFDRPARLNAGFEYRLDKYEVERGEAASYYDAGANDPARLPVPAGSVGYPGFALETGEDRSGYGFYVDLAADLTKALGLYTAVRMEDFDGLGTLTNAQVGFAYQFSEKLQVRLGAAGGDRAPSIAQQAYARTVDTLETGGTAQSGVYRPDSALAATLGGSALDAESTLSLSGGFTYIGPADVTLRVDVYQIDVDDRVILSDFQSVGTPAGSARFAVNGVDMRHRGVDAELAWSTSGGWGELDLSLGLNIADVSADAASSISSALVGARTEDQLTTAWPESKLILAGNWRRGRFDLNARATGYGSTEDQAANAGAGQKVDSAWLLDLDLRYQATPIVGFSIGVHNLLDEYPDVFPREAGAPNDNLVYPYTAYSPYGFDGRYAYARIEARFD